MTFMPIQIVGLIMNIVLGSINSVAYGKTNEVPKFSPDVDESQSDVAESAKVDSTDSARALPMRDPGLTYKLVGFSLIGTALGVSLLYGLGAASCKSACPNDYRNELLLASTTILTGFGLFIVGSDKGRDYRRHRNEIRLQQKFEKVEELYMEEGLDRRDPATRHEIKLKAKYENLKLKLNRIKTEPGQSAPRKTLEIPQEGSDQEEQSTPGAFINIMPAGKGAAIALTVNF